MRGYELLVFLNICIEQSDGEEEVDIDKVIAEVIGRLFTIPARKEIFSLPDVSYFG